MNLHMKPNMKDLTTLDEILDRKYGKRGARKREEWEHEFEAFRLRVLLEEARVRREIRQR